MKDTRFTIRAAVTLPVARFKAGITFPFVYLLPELTTYALKRYLP